MRYLLALFMKCHLSKETLRLLFIFFKFTISWRRISDTNKEIFAWGKQSLYHWVSISVLKASRKTKPSNLYLHWLLQEEEKKKCLLHPRGGGAVVVGCRHKVLCLWWGNGFCTCHMLKLLSFVFSAQIICVLISENMAFYNGGSFFHQQWLCNRTLSKNISPFPLLHTGVCCVDLVILYQLPGSL